MKTKHIDKKELKLVTYAFKAFFSLLWLSFRVVCLRLELAARKVTICKLTRKRDHLLLKFEDISLNEARVQKENK